jgi:ParB family chromosome partitioning protein
MVKTATTTHARPQFAAVRTLLPPAAIVPDPRSRRIVEDDDFDALCDSIRVLGVLLPLQVVPRSDGMHCLIDGERRWRAAQKVGLAETPCDVWPADTDARRVAVAGLVLNEHRKAHGNLAVARRLRDLKNECGHSHAEVATHTGIPLDRVKTYFSLFAASDGLMAFLEENEIPLKVAVELVRYERATNEARARRLTQRHKDSPLTVQEIIALRKREQRAPKTKKTAETPPVSERHRPPAFVERFETAVRKDPGALVQLEELARRLGSQLVPLPALQVKA